MTTETNQKIYDFVFISVRHVLNDIYKHYFEIELNGCLCECTKLICVNGGLRHKKKQMRATEMTERGEEKGNNQLE